MYRFRQMRTSDKAPLRKMLNKHSDVPQKWRNFLVISKYNTGVHVITWYNQIVGMTHVAMPSHGEAWLESAYIIPSHRGHGVGTSFTEYQIRYAKNKGAHVVRVATGSQNKRVQHLMIDKLRFKRLSTWYRIKITAGGNNSSINSAVRQIDNRKLSEYWSYIYHHPESRASGRVITSPRDNCWFYGLDYRALERILTNMESLGYITHGQIQGIMLVKKAKGMNFNAPVVLQAFCNNNKIYEELLKRILSYNSTLFLSVSKSPKQVLARLKKNGNIDYYNVSKWVLMERELY